MFFDEIPKHRKKRKKIAPRKSKYKHNYVEFVGHFTNRKLANQFGEGERYSFFLLEKCSICGKERMKSWIHRLPNQQGKMFINLLEEAKELYPHLEIVEMGEFEDWWRR